VSPEKVLAKFRSGVEAMALAILQRNPSPSGQSTAARAVQHLAEETLERYQQDRRQIACRPGCGDCCQVNVTVLAPETEAIDSYLRQHLSPEKLAALRRDAHRLRLQVGGLNDEERLLARRSCLFLDSRRCCGIYPVRPLLCRSMTSTDPERCREAIALAALDQAPTVICHLWQQQLFLEAFRGLAAAMRATGGEDRSQQLVEAIWQRLRQPSGSSGGHR